MKTRAQIFKSTLMKVSVSHIMPNRMVLAAVEPGGGGEEEL